MAWRSMPPKDMGYVPFDELPRGATGYKSSFYKLAWREYTGKQWECAYEVYFKSGGKWYMHVNYYYHPTKKPSAVFGKVYVYPMDSLAHWRDAEGKEAPYIHSNRRRKVKQ